jgi:nucleoside-diphosphate-sugar epimerase
MKVLVTGGAGFLGTHLVKRLQRRGATVRIFGRAPQEEGRDGLEVIRGDIRDEAAVERAMAGADKVVHLVSNFRKGGSDRHEAYGINVQGTENVLRAAVKHGVARLVHCSTIGVHGNVREIPATEETPFNPGDLYQQTKLIAEKKVWDMHRQTGLPVSVVRPISMFGPGDLRMLKLFRMIGKGRFLVVGDGSPFFQPAYIDDVVAGFVLCLEQEGALGEAFIVGGEEYLPLRDLFRLIAEELEVSPPRWRVPLAPVLFAASLCEKLCAPLGVEPPLHRRRVSFFQNNRAFRVEKAKRLLGYRPQVALREGIRRTVAWYRQNGLL